MLVFDNAEEAGLEAVQRAIVIHSAHPYHFKDLTIGGTTFGQDQGWAGYARALSEDYEDLSKLRELVRELLPHCPKGKANDVNTLATKLKCFE